MARQNHKLMILLKFFEYDLLMKSTEEGVRKLPILCVWIKEITRKATSATVLLTDFTSDIKGTIDSSFLKNKENFSYLMIGSVLFLKDVTFFITSAPTVLKMCLILENSNLNL